MTRSRLKNIATKTRLDQDFEKYKRQRKYVCSLVKKYKKYYFKNTYINTKNSKDFWKVCKPFLDNKAIISQNRIFLEENERLITNESEIASKFNDYFRNVVKSLNLHTWHPTHSITSNGDLLYPDFQLHPSIMKIREHFKVENEFNFSHTSTDTVKKIIHQLKKGDESVPIDVMNTLSKSFCQIICQCINSCIDQSYFPDKLKQANIIPIHKKESTSKPENYRPISILPTFSKVFERLMFNQITDFFQDKFSKFLCGFRKGYSTQTALLRLIRNWESFLDQKMVIGTVLIDLSKAYDCIQHNLLLAKLEAYGFSKKSLKLLKSYLSGRKQRVKLYSTFSEWLWVEFGIPQGSILGPLLFNIFINDIFFFNKQTDMCNFADDNTIYTCDSDIFKVRQSLIKDLEILNRWFSDNSLIANHSKFQLMYLGSEKTDLKIEINNKVIYPQKEVELLGLTIDNKLSFSLHIKRICKSANNKLCAILRLRRSLSISQTKLLMNAHVFSYFHYCPLIWMFCLKTDITRINKVHKRCLRILYNDFTLSLNDLLDIDKSVNIHRRHLQSLMIEIFKSRKNLNPIIVSELFENKYLPYNLRNSNILKLPSALSTRYGTNSVLFKGSLVWNTLPAEIKSLTTLSAFQKKIKLWKFKNCSCSICH